MGATWRPDFSQLPAALFRSGESQTKYIDFCSLNDEADVVRGRKSSNFRSHPGGPLDGIRVQCPPFAQFFFQISFKVKNKF
jgi:hypothetical protein